MELSDRIPHDQSCFIEAVQKNPDSTVVGRGHEELYDGGTILMGAILGLYIISRIYRKPKSSSSD